VHPPPFRLQCSVARAHVFAWVCWVSRSPEVCERKPYGFRSDMWALGCILFELCTLKRAFHASNIFLLAHKIVNVRGCAWRPTAPPARSQGGVSGRGPGRPARAAPQCACSALTPRPRAYVCCMLPVPCTQPISPHAAPAMHSTSTPASGARATCHQAALSPLAF
jgi:serine/threonine protein kinase